MDDGAAKLFQSVICGKVGLSDSRNAVSACSQLAARLWQHCWYQLYPNNFVATLTWPHPIQASLLLEQYEFNRIRFGITRAPNVPLFHVRWSLKESSNANQTVLSNTIQLQPPGARRCRRLHREWWWGCGRLPSLGLFASLELVFV